MPCKLVDGTIEENYILHLFSFLQKSDFLNDEEHFHVITLGDVKGKKDVLFRIESACTYAHLYGSQLCDCQYQKNEALLKLSKEGEGIYLYCLDQHGRGTGIVNHVKSYQAEQELGLDTVEAHRHLGFPDDARDYNPIIQILKHFRIRSVRLMTNNPNRIDTLEKADIKVKRISFQGPLHRYNYGELKTKTEKLGHLYDYDFSKPLLNTIGDDNWMKHAIHLAKTKGKVIDKPLVGALIVKNGQLVSEGYGVQNTHLHAEAMAILNAGEKAQNGTLYTTLEPCTDAYFFPSCCRKTIDARVAEVVIGVVDPHPLISGRGIKTLQNAGINIRFAAEKEAKKLIEQWKRKWEV